MVAERAVTQPRSYVPTGRTILGVLASAVFGIMVGTLCAALLAIQGFGYKVVTVQSRSMEPNLSRGDLVFARPVGIDDVNPGQVILFEEGRDVRLLVVHRVNSVINLTTNASNTTTGEVTTQKSRLLRTKGDANPATDIEPIDASRLRGRVWFVIPRAGLVLHRIPLQFLLLGIAGLTAVAWIVYEWRQRAGTRPDSHGRTR